MGEIDENNKWTPEDQAELERLEKAAGIVRGTENEQKPEEVKEFPPFSKLMGMLQEIKQNLTNQSESLQEGEREPFPLIEHPESFRVGDIYFEWNEEWKNFFSFVRRRGVERKGVPQEGFQVVMGYEISKLRKDVDLLFTILTKLDFIEKIEAPQEPKE